MTAQEYLEIFKELGLKRSAIVKLIERQIRILDKHNLDSTEAKWIAIEIAEQEKLQGYPFFEEESSD